MNDDEVLPMMHIDEVTPQLAETCSVTEACKGSCCKRQVGSCLTCVELPSPFGSMCRVK